MNLYYTYEIPDGYITGLSREYKADERLVAHLYKGTFSDPGAPMCKRGWNRENRSAYSIWRNNVGIKGICKVCMRRAIAKLEPIGAVENEEPFYPLDESEAAFIFSDEELKDE